MSTRLAQGGLLTGSGKPVSFTFNGKRLKGVEGDTIASALLANDQMLVGRSFKYHRPRGIVGSGAEEPNALLNMGTGNSHEPNQRATTTELFDGLSVTSQNHWPSLEFDVGAINTHLSRFLPAGFYYKMFIHPRPLWKHVYEPFIRKSAGLGAAPDPETRDPDTYEHYYHFTDVMIIGGGIAGLVAAKAAAKTGAKVLLVEQTAHWGGRALVDGGDVDGTPAAQMVARLTAELEAMDNVVMRTRLMGAGVYDHGYVLGYERLREHQPGAQGPRHRLWRIRAAQIITATGAIERPLSFAGNDVPGVMLASAVRDYAALYGVSIGDRTVIVTNNDDAYRTAILLKGLGLEVPCIVDARAGGAGALGAQAEALGIRVETGKGVAKVLGKKRVEGIALCAQAGEGAVLEEIACDALAMSGGWSPVVHLWSHCGGKLTWDAAQAHFRPDADRPPTGADGNGFVTVAGSANGHLQMAELVGDYTPISMGAIGGEARGDVFQPLRRTPVHDWLETNGADWEPVGAWRRPFAILQPGESVQTAVNREVKNTRENLGLLDASTLGKLVVKGPDAGKFLDMLYTNMMSTLKPGKCRYGLMCGENGFLVDDGVVARIDEDTFLCHTTTGGADSIHAHMEEWLQTEWWDWKVYVANVTEQFAQIAVVGPNARKVLEKLGGMDDSKYALGFMEWADGQIGGFDARVYRISFSGLSKKKEDYLGKRAHLRSHMADPDRWKLVGLETLDGSVLPDGAYATGEGVNANGQRNVIGRVTSTYYSATFERGIAMGLVKHGPDRIGDVIDFPKVDGAVVQARIVDPVLYDKDGEKQNV